jgi:hypothetical protein
MDEKFKVFLQMVTGFLIMVASTIGFWHSHEILGFLLSVLLGAGGFFLTLSKGIVLYGLGWPRKIIFWVVAGLFMFLIASFMPLLCIPYIPPGFTYSKCHYVTFWEFFFG